MFDRRRPTATRVRRAGWRLSGALLLEVAACSIAMGGLISGSGWWVALMGIAAVLLMVPAVLRLLGIPAWLASLIDLAFFAALVDLLYGGPATLLGVLPTRASMDHVGRLVLQALQAIRDQGVPADPLPELVFFVVVTGGAFAFLLDLVAHTLRMPAATALAMLAVLTVPVVLQPDGLTLTALAACAIAWLLVLGADGRLRFGARGGAGAAMAIGASATLIAVVVAATAPGFARVGRSADVAGSVSIGNSVNPLIDLSRDLLRPTVVPVLQYTTDSKDPLYLQLTTLDMFTGTIWRHQPGADHGVIDGSVGTAPGLETDARAGAQTVTTRIQVQNLVSDWMPAPYPVTRITGAPTQLSYQARDLTLSGRSAELGGSDYTTTSLDLQPSAAQLENVTPIEATTLPQEVQRELYLPGAIPRIITDTAESVAAGADGTSEFDLAVALQEYFQSSLNGFSYSTQTPDSVDGTSLAVVAAFLKQKEGYCVHFATAMAVLARVLGIPSRIAIGYQPGSAVRVNGDKTTFAVDSSDLHAWPQLYFPGRGWLDFEPTVSRGSAPAYTVPQTTTPDETAPSSAATARTPSAAASSAAPQLPDQQNPLAGNDVAARNQVPLALGLLVLLAILAAPAAARRLLRRSRLRRLRDEGGPPTLAWAEVRDAARDLGFATSPTETPRAFAARLREGWHPDAAPQAELDAILELVETSEYGPPRPWARYYDLAETTAAVVTALAADRPRPARVRAVLAPASLLAALTDRRREGVRTTG